MAKVCFLLGIMPRSGTNFVENQLRLHPSCAAPGPVWEDFLVGSASSLKFFVNKLSGKWDGSWFTHYDFDCYARLERNIGKGLESFLLEQLTEKDNIEYLISKTPTVAGLENFQRFFSDCKLLLVVRDGRAVVESGQRTFDWDFEKAVYDWCLNARKIIKYMEVFPQGAFIVRYEELCDRPAETMAAINEYLGIDFRLYPLEAQQQLPVSGSSELKATEGGVHWQPVSRSGDFDPLMRFAHWSPWRHKVFGFLANAEMSKMGYGSTRELSALDRILVALYLATWPLRSFPVICYHAIKNRKLILKTN